MDARGFLRHENRDKSRKKAVKRGILVTIRKKGGIPMSEYDPIPIEADETTQAAEAVQAPDAP